MKSGLVHGHELRKTDNPSDRRGAPQNPDDTVSPASGVVHRVHGKVVSKEEWEEARKYDDSRSRYKRQRELDTDFERRQDVSWKRGLVQKTEKDVKYEEYSDLVTSSFDDELRRRQRKEDPMSRSQPLPQPTSKPRSIYEAPVNRFGISAGYRWDGVVRGTSYDQRWFERQNEMKSGIHNSR
jgi:hypothetical protein